MSDLSIQVSQELIRPIIEAKIQAAIVCELEKERNLIPQMVQAALNTKVDCKGNVSSYSSDNKYTYIERLCNEAIQKTAKESLKDYLEENIPNLKKELKIQLEKQSNNMAEVFIKGVIDCLESNWRFDCHVNLSNPKE